MRRVFGFFIKFCHKVEVVGIDASLDCASDGRHRHVVGINPPPPLIGIFPSRSICSRFLHRVTIYFQYHRFSVTPPFVVNAAAMPRESHTLPAKFERSYLGLIIFVISIILGVIFSYF